MTIITISDGTLARFPATPPPCDRCLYDGAESLRVGSWVVAEECDDHAPCEAPNPDDEDALTRLVDGADVRINNCTCGTLLPPGPYPNHAADCPRWLAVIGESWKRAVAELIKGRKAR